MHLLKKGLYFFMCLLPLASLALPEDKNKKIYITSKDCIYNYKKGTSLFQGNVTVDQGSTHLTADKLSTKNNEQHKLREAIAYGITQYAHYWTLPKMGDPLVHANARIIKFYPMVSNVELQKDVLVTQGNNSFHGDLIHYNFNNQTITVPASKTGRAVLVYNPDN